MSIKVQIIEVYLIIEMTEKEIPEKEERFCIECSREQDFEKVRTEQKPVAIEIHWGSRGCWGPRRKAEWKWECLECGEVNY